MILKCFRENSTIGLLKKDKAANLTKIQNDLFPPRIVPLNLSSNILFVQMAKKKIDLFKMGEPTNPQELFKIGHFYTMDNVTVAHQCESLIFVGCLQQKIDVLTAESFVKFKRFNTNSHPSYFCQLTKDHILVGQFNGDIAFIDLKQMTLREVCKIGKAVIKIECIAKMLNRNHIAIATQNEGLFIAKYDISPHTNMMEIEIVKKNKSNYLEGHQIIFVDEYQPFKLIAFVENSGCAALIDLKTETVVDFTINKAERLFMYGIAKMPRSQYHYLVKHRYGFKLVNPVTKRWHELCHEP